MVSFWILLLSLLISVLLRPFSYQHEILLASKHSPESSGGQTDNILLLTAHPDDESMFFAPTILGLTSSHSNSPITPTLFSLCLSVGNADGLGDVRRQELERSLNILGIVAGHRWIVDRPDLQDNISVAWDARTVAHVARPYVLSHNITTILTFDAHGVSSHPNHISLLHGASHLLASWPAPSSPISHSAPAPRLFSLVSVPLATKYSGVLGALALHLRLRLLSFIRHSGLAPMGGWGTGTPVFASGMREYRVALRAMQEHRSQLVWFRWLYVAFSRYMWANEWAEVVPVLHSASTAV
ncbi:LmbE-like protein [Obba rivulosa]|uniref:N-acetylglucosaminylphosphatidylinositol deacetylase n=1 Tax=Obba rivulosa TaxID=1052685 RepID=A0A8E2AL25_9APHY|nr:LmbE-like protein [Obba rivulosa]